ncbi:hypothetical protein H9P43_004934 [Blastocladiella emersonii ATCC 22665]|nr:hypothetical protein H9P43_004934 [Blastocladiella emersonii ATCC 22665]
MPRLSSANVALALIAVLASLHAAHAIYIDHCGANEFERLFSRSNYMVMDSFALTVFVPDLAVRNPQVHMDVTRYKRDFADATKWEKETFITWRFPNGEQNNKLFFVVNEMVPEQLIPNQNNLMYSWSNDDKTYTPVQTSAISSTTEPLSDKSWVRRNVTLTLPEPARYFKMVWPSCEWDDAAKRATCRNYYSPSINHFCAANTQKNEDANVQTCYPAGDEPNPKAVDPTPKYCGTDMINNFWDDTIFGASKNNKGAYSAADGTSAKTGHHVPKMGLGQGELYMNVSSSTIWIESLTANNKCYDASAYTHLHLEITARSDFSVDIGLEQGTADKCDQRGGSQMSWVNSASYTKWSRLAKRKVVIPLADIKPALNLKNLRSIQMRNFKNPSNQWVYMDNIAFVGAPVYKPVAASPKQVDLEAGKESASVALGCTDASKYNNEPAVKFHAVSSTAGAKFKVQVGVGASGKCGGSADAVSTFDSSKYTTFPLDDLAIPFEFSIPVPEAKGKALSTLKFTDIQPAGAKIAITKIRLGSASCMEPADPLHPDWDPVPYPAGFKQAIYEVWPNPAGTPWVDPPAVQGDMDTLDHENHFDDSTPNPNDRPASAVAGSNGDKNAASDRAVAGAGVVAAVVAAAVALMA